MDVKIGMAESGRELTISVSGKPADIEKQVDAAITGGTTLRLADDKGRQVVVSGAQIAYVEIGPADGRRVGFAISE